MAFRSDLDTLILGVLQGGPLHGYDISKRIKDLSQEALKVGEGQLYPALHKLEEDKLIRSQWIEQEGKPPKKVYALTARGSGMLKKQKQEWKKFSAGVGAVLNLKVAEARP